MSNVDFIINELKKLYPNADCSLDYKNEFELLFATRLSAQCTDKRVNMVTPVLFEKYKTLSDYANADIADIENIVKSAGFYKDKAKSIKETAIKLINEYNGKLPSSIEELIKLPGVGRKTANLIMAQIFHKPAIIADTHCIRISNRLGLADTKDPHKVEIQLKKIIPNEEQSALCHRFVSFGRDICKAQNPKCESCVFKSICKYEKQLQ